MILSCFSPNDRPHELWWYSLCRLQICYWRCVSEAWAKPNRNKCFHRYRAGGLRSSNNFCSIKDIVGLIFPFNIFLLSHRYILFSDVVGLLCPSDIFHSSRHGQSSPHRVGVIVMKGPGFGQDWVRVATLAAGASSSEESSSELDSSWAKSWVKQHAKRLLNRRLQGLYPELYISRTTKMAQSAE